MQCAQDIPEGIFGVGVIDKYLKMSLGWNALQAARNLGRRGERRDGVSQIYAAGIGCGNSPHGIVNIEKPDEW